MKSATMDSSPANNAKSNIAATRGLTANMVTTAQALSNELGQAENLLIPLDQYSKTTTTAAGGETQ
ncbi:hypothetical protein ACIGCM_21155 [Pseudomonas sp. NPDC078700]|uniref:hypothetical protein n=1 Tax=Pseudomonas sp. NPDC078700 TaxID=3364424 RepID=UPI0037C83E98